MIEGWRRKGRGTIEGGGWFDARGGAEYVVSAMVVYRGEDILKKLDMFQKIVYFIYNSLVLN